MHLCEQVTATESDSSEGPALGSWNCGAMKLLTLGKVLTLAFRRILLCLGGIGD